MCSWNKETESGAVRRPFRERAAEKKKGTPGEGRVGGRPGPRHTAVLTVGSGRAGGPCCEGSRARAARLGSARLGLLPPAPRTAFLGHPANVNEARFLCVR